MNKAMMGITLLLGAFGLGFAGQMQMMDNCPMHVEGVKLAVADTSDGVALTFATESGNVDDLRKRVERMAAMFDTKADRPGMMANRMIAASAKYEAVPNGARLTLTPKDATQLDALRRQMRERAERMEKGECPMMQGMGGGMRREGPDSGGRHDPDHRR